MPVRALHAAPLALRLSAHDPIDAELPVLDDAPENQRRTLSSAYQAVILSRFGRSPGHEGFLRGRHVSHVRFWAGSENQKRHREEDSRRSRQGASHPLGAQLVRKRRSLAFHSAPAADLGSCAGSIHMLDFGPTAFQRSDTTSPVLCSVTATSLPSRARGGQQNDPARRTPGSGAGPRAVTGPPPRPGCQHPRLTCGSSSCDQPAGPGMGRRTGCSRRPPGPGWVPGRHRPAVPRS